MRWIKENLGMEEQYSPQWQRSSNRVLAQRESGRATNQTDNEKIGRRMCKMKKLYFG